MQASPRFTPIPLSGYNLSPGALTSGFCSEEMLAVKDRLLRGKKTLWGIPFELGPETGDNLVYSGEGGLTLEFAPISADYLVFVHTADLPRPVPGEDGIVRHFRGEQPLGEKVCDYVIRYGGGDDVAEEVVPIRNRFEINNIALGWGQEAFGAQPHERHVACPTVSDDLAEGRMPSVPWGPSQYRVASDGSWPLQWLYAWKNPHPEMEITGIGIRHASGGVYLMGVTAAHVKAHPLRYGRRQKTVLKLDGSPKNPLSLIDIDLGQIISVIPRPMYDDAGWEAGYNNQQPKPSDGEYIVEFAAHEDARLYLGAERKPLAVRDLPGAELARVLPAEQPVTLRVLGPDGKPAAVKVHAHGAGGEYLPPRHRHRIPNPYWFEDYSADFVHGPHWCTYIDGAAEYLLPQGEIFVEVSKGFEIRPIRRRFEITPDIREIVIQLDHVLDWRGKGWVTADTHVHFLSPQTALLEGEAEGVNVVNLLASQWGELFTNVGDFDGKSVISSANSGDEYMVRVGTENRQHILGHISLLGYDGAMILPLTTGGPDESALGDPVETTLTQWAAQCRAQAGVSILPHFPNPRCEGSAAIVSELIDGVEMTSWGGLYDGISPYSLADWYRYLNCGYHVAAVGGTDKMSAETAVGTVRTYALVDGPLTYPAWKDAIKAGRTFATYGALADLRVEGKLPGGRVDIHGPATLQVQWSVASVTIPITAVELVVGGETAEAVRFDSLIGSKDGYFEAKVTGGTWIALRVRGHQKDKPEIITAHTSAVMVYADGKRPMSAPDAATILEQIEGATAYITTLGTKAQDRQFMAALTALTAAHRALHNRLHEMGYYHKHTAVDEHHHE
ncbi:MAG: CehA/McbA family metallohydrolase [Defluviitaleaceae bacterium]|nr:CehA/McbA family metallohydrolase [Defluviitaleaceae bacterium]